jgi:hypothetical protein
MATTSSSTSTRRLSSDTSDTTTKPAKSDTADTTSKAGFIGNAAPIDADATPAKTFAGSGTKDPYELAPETHGAHDRNPQTDI